MLPSLSTAGLSRRPALSIALVSPDGAGPAASAAFRTRLIQERSDIRPDDDIVLFYGLGMGREVRRFSLDTGPELPPAAVLTPLLDHEDVAMALDHGVTSYFVRSQRSCDLFAVALTSRDETIPTSAVAVEQVRTARRERKTVTTPHASADANLPSPLSPSPEAAARLTPRERELMARLASGDTIREVGVNMGLSQKTVTNYQGRIYQKLNVRNCSEAILCWLGVLPPG